MLERVGVAWHASQRIILRAQKGSFKTTRGPNTYYVAYSPNPKPQTLYSYLDFFGFFLEGGGGGGKGVEVNEKRSVSTRVANHSKP